MKLQKIRLCPDHGGIDHVQFQDEDGDWRWFCDCGAKWDADELVRRWNSHEQMVSALKAALELGAFSGDRLPIKVARPVLEAIRSALKEAGHE